jgi:hypothetical protein
MKAPTPNSQHPITRRGIFVGAVGSILCAPAIVRATSLMPVRSLILPIEHPWAGFVERLRFDGIAKALRRGWDFERDEQTFGCSSEYDARKSVDYARAQGWLPRD